jgi:cobalt-zinc-cadmium efflux system membrane fusion protein
VGTYATAETSLATIVDTSTVWGLLDVREYDVARVQVGQKVTMDVDGLSDRSYAGEVTRVSAEVDERTRTVTATAEFSNPDGLLRAHQFARARIHIARPREAVVVPLDCVQRLGEDRVVFVRARGGVYDTVPVTLGRRVEDMVELVGPVAIGDEIVTTGAFLLKTELLKDSIGAGCCDVEGPGGN